MIYERETNEIHYCRKGSIQPALTISTPQFTSDTIEQVFSLDGIEPDHEAQKQRREQLKKSDSIVFLGHTDGLGDQVQVLRYARILGKKLGKQVTCTVSEDMLSILESPQFQNNDDTCKFVTHLDDQALAGQEPFLILLGRWTNLSSAVKHLDIEGKISVKEQFSDILPDDMAQAAIFQSPNRVHDQVRLFGENYYSYQRMQKIMRVLHSSKTPLLSTTDLFYAFQLHLLGIDVSAKDLHESLISFKDKTMPKQDIDLLIVPDAKEGNMSSKEPPRSNKSFSPEQWEDIFRHMKSSFSMPRHIGVVIGKEHREYTELVLAKAHTHLSGWLIDRIEGDLPNFGNTVLRSKTFFGMDSGTTHLANEIATEARAVGHDIKLLQVFYQSESIPYTQYGVRGLDDAKALVVDGPNVGSLTLGNPDSVAAFLMDNWTNPRANPIF